MISLFQSFLYISKTLFLQFKTLLGIFVLSKTECSWSQNRLSVTVLKEVIKDKVKPEFDGIAVHSSISGR